MPTTGGSSGPPQSPPSSPAKVRPLHPAGPRAPHPAAPIRGVSRRPAREPACLALGPSPLLTNCSPCAHLVQASELNAALPHPPLSSTSSSSSSS
eukprot:5343413-Prymnesium_polylepis.1